MLTRISNTYMKWTRLSNIHVVPDLADECCFDEGERTTECSLTEAPSSMFRIRLNLPEGVCECDSEITTTITIVTVTDG